MKHLFFLASLFLFFTYVQAQTDLFKKYGIKKMTVVSQSEGEPDKTTITYFDEEGNDTATYQNGTRYQYKQLSYDKSKRLIKREDFWPSGEKYTTYVYQYNADGSYTSSDEDTQFKLKSTSWYNANGKLIKLKTPDGTIRSYTLDSKGNAVKVVTTPTQGKATMAMAKLKYDGSRVVQSVWSDGATSTYVYDKRGLLTQSTYDFKGNDELAAYSVKSTYQYE